MNRKFRSRATSCLLLACAVAMPAASLAAPPPDPKACEPGSTSRLEHPPTQTPGTRDPSVTTGSGRNESLSDRLARSDGVLCPPDVDSNIRRPPPGSGKTPVIPPPGSPGGDPNVQPK